MKRVLIITYYWPPSGGAGVQRWLKFVKYLRKFGWEPVIYTPLNPEAPAIDNSLISDLPDQLEVLKTRIWEPYLLYKRFIGKKSDENIKAGFLTEKKGPGILEKISIWIRGNMFIPDARKFWIRPSIKYLTNYLAKNPVNVVVSTGPPHSMHCIALGLKKKLNVNWLADFRDPWTNIDFYNKLLLSKYADKKNQRLEREVLKKADKVITVSWSWAEDLMALGAPNVEVITNGFDPDDINIHSNNTLIQFEICHIGALNQDRNPEKLWQVISELNKQIKDLRNDLKITFIGFTDYSLQRSIAKYNLQDIVDIIDYMPHKDVLHRAAKASAFLLPLNNTPNVQGIIPGKLYEYLALNKPILCIGPEYGDAARIVRETGSGFVVGFDDSEKMKDILINMYNLYKSGNLKVHNTGIKQFSRESLTMKMSKVLDRLYETSI